MFPSFFNSSITASLSWFIIGIIVSGAVAFWQQYQHSQITLVSAKLLPHVLLLYWYVFFVIVYPSSISSQGLLVLNSLITIGIVLLLLAHWFVSDKLKVAFKQWEQALVFILCFFIYIPTLQPITLANASSITGLLAGVVLGQLLMQLRGFVIWLRRGSNQPAEPVRPVMFLAGVLILELITLSTNYFWPWLNSSVMIYGWLLFISLTASLVLSNRAI